jgi:hypothetical protein
VTSRAPRSCFAKLYYRKLSYLITLQDNEYKASLADSGFMVEYIAKAQLTCGVDLTKECDPHSAFAKTRKIMTESKDAVVFEGGSSSTSFMPGLTSFIARATNCI